MFGAARQDGSAAAVGRVGKGGAEVGMGWGIDL